MTNLKDLEVITKDGPSEPEEPGEPEEGPGCCVYFDATFLDKILKCKV